MWLSTKNIKTARPSEKLDHKRLGPFAIVKIVSSHTYHLELPLAMKIHPVFHVSLLEPVSEDPVPRQVMLPPLPVEIEGHQEWKVEEVLDSCLRYPRPQYLVKWLGYDAPTWQPAHDLENAAADVEHFHRLHPNHPVCHGFRLAVGFFGHRTYRLLSRAYLLGSSDAWPVAYPGLL